MAKLGHLSKEQASLIATIPVVKGQVIYSEKHNAVFADYEGKRHVYSSVLSGIFNESGYVDFTTSELSTVLDCIKQDNTVSDGQLINSNNSVYMHKKINDNDFLIKIDDTETLVKANKVGYIIHLPEYKDGDSVNIDLLISISNSVNGDKLFLIKIENNMINYNACEDMDGTFNQNNLNLQLSNTNGLFAFSLTVESKIKIVSYSVTSTGNSDNQGFYVVAG